MARLNKEARRGKAKWNKGKVKQVGQVSKAFEQQRTHMSSGESMVVFICYFHPFFGFS